MIEVQTNLKKEGILIEQGSRQLDIIKLRSISYH
jgi:hypothetical protein